MEDDNKGGMNHRERSDYAKDESRNGYTPEGRKLRPRRKVSQGHAPGGDQPRRFSDEPREGGYGQHRNHGPRSGGYGSGPHRSYGAQGESRRPYGEERRPYGEERRPYGEERRPYGEERRPYGEERRPYGEERRPYGGSRTLYGSRPRPDGERRTAFRSPEEGGEDRPYRSHARPAYGQGRKPAYGESRRPYGEHRYPARQDGHPAPRKKFRREEAQFTKNDEAGINQMLSRKPRLDEAVFSDNDMAPSPMKEEIRLNKFIANSGVCSRRAADTLIQAGAITVNGQVVTELGTKVNVLKDDIRMSGEPLKGEKKVYAVMNKPKGFVTSASDPHAEKTVMDLMKDCTARVFPVGRLDKNTTGVLMFTNDGEIAEQLTHPSYNKKKIYQVILDKALEETDKEKILQEGLELNDGVIKADELEYIDDQDHRRLGIEIHSGKNRIVRRIFESLGYEVKALDRVYFAGLTKKGLKKGEWRYLSEGEVNVLKMGAYV